MEVESAETLERRANEGSVRPARGSDAPMCLFDCVLAAAARQPKQLGGRVRVKGDERGGGALLEEPRRRVGTRLCAAS